MAIWTSILVGSCVVWVCLWFMRLRFWCSAAREPSEMAAPAWRVSCIVPARNEERNLPACLASLSRQPCPEMEIIVVDDQSADATPECIDTARISDDRVRSLRCSARPAEWAGKTWALTQGAQLAGGEWLVFCDGDIVLAPDAFRTVKAMIDQEDLDCLSVVPQMRNSCFPVALLLACFATARAILFRPAAPGRRGLTQGAFLAIRRSAYDAIGGFSRFKGSLIEDVQLGYACQEAGFKVRTQPPSPLAWTHMYSSVQDAWEGLCKHVYPAMECSVCRIGLAVGACMGLILFPVLSLMVSAILVIVQSPITGVPIALAASLSAVVVMYACLGKLLASESLPSSACVLVPVSMFIFGAIALDSVRRYGQGRVRWKGREYGAASI